jgi:hypothetical protein
VAAVDHDAGDIDIGVVVLLAQLASVLVQQLTHEFSDLVVIQIRRVLGLLEEESCWVFQLFHLIQKYYGIASSHQPKSPLDSSCIFIYSGLQS